MNSILSKLNAQLEKYNNGCGKSIESEYGDSCGEFDVGRHEIILLCPSCQAGKNATEKAIEIVKAKGNTILEFVSGLIDVYKYDDAMTKEVPRYVVISNLRLLKKQIKETLGKIDTLQNGEETK